jgi:hypothetical protein
MWSPPAVEAALPGKHRIGAGIMIKHLGHFRGPQCVDHSETSTSGSEWNEIKALSHHYAMQPGQLLRVDSAPRVSRALGVSIQPYYGLQEISWSPKYGLCLGLAICRFTNKIQLSSSCSVECAREEERREGVSLTLSFSHSAILANSLTLHGQTESGGHVVVLAVRCMLEPVRPGAVSPDRALCLPTYSHFLIVNKTSFSLSLSLPPSTLSHLSTDRQERKQRKPGLFMAFMKIPREICWHPCGPG